jgi:hypothetical protein
MICELVDEQPQQRHQRRQLRRRGRLLGHRHLGAKLEYRDNVYSAYTGLLTEAHVRPGRHVRGQSV